MSTNTKKAFHATDRVDHQFLNCFLKFAKYSTTGLLWVGPDKSLHNRGPHILPTSPKGTQSLPGGFSSAKFECLTKSNFLGAPTRCVHPTARSPCLGERTDEWVGHQDFKHFWSQKHRSMAISFRNSNGCILDGFTSNSTKQCKVFLPDGWPINSATGAYIRTTCTGNWFARKFVVFSAFETKISIISFKLHFNSVVKHSYLALAIIHV